MKLISHFVAEPEGFVARCISTGVTEEAKRLTLAASSTNANRGVVTDFCGQSRTDSDAVTQTDILSFTCTRMHVLRNHIYFSAF